MEQEQKPEKTKLVWEYWVLSEEGTSRAFPFKDKHTALESLELTYPEAVLDQTFEVEWATPSHQSAYIKIDGVALYSLGARMGRVKEVADKLPLHPHARPQQRKQIAEQLRALSAWWSRLNGERPLTGKEMVELQNVISSTETLLRTFQQR